MKMRMRPRFYCDFCKKSGGSGGHMSRHERGCTMNPSRFCGLCAAARQQQPSLHVLLALLPERTISEGDLVAIMELEPRTIKVEGVDVLYDVLQEALAVALPRLRDAAGGCPACMFAAIRQKNLHDLCTFQFGQERDKFWAKVNEARAIGEQHEMYP